jgi:pimeloyl-ACP methyl ester carboxylesterase
VSRVLPERRLPDTRLRDALQIHGELVELDTELGAELMYHDAEPDAAAAAMARTRPVQRAVFRGMPASVAWHRVPSSYAVCGADRVLHPEMQRAMAKRATTSVEWSCGHSSPIVRPDDVVRLITDAVRLSSVQSG